MTRLAAGFALLLASSVAWPAGGTEAVAHFAGGCFWCMEADFEKLDGVLGVTSGYMGGRTAHPDYDSVSRGTTGHLEAVEVRYDPRRIDYSALLAHFWRRIDPTDDGGQFCDRGSQYRSAIFVSDDGQRRAAEASREAVASRLGIEPATRILPATRFWPAEPYHQDYAQRNPVRYLLYRLRCGRDARLAEVWGR